MTSDCTSTRWRIWWRRLSWGIAGLGLGTTLILLNADYSGLASRSWIEVEAEVTALNFTVRGETRITRIVYTYAVTMSQPNGAQARHEETRDRVQYGLFPTTAQEFFWGLSSGDSLEKVRVFYNPSHPSESVIIPGLSRKDAFFLGGAASLFLLGVGMLSLTHLRSSSRQ